MDATDLRHPPEHAQAWVTRCPACGKTRPLKAVQAVPRTPDGRTLSWCTRCRGLRFVHIEPVEGPAVAPGEDAAAG